MKNRLILLIIFLLAIMLHCENKNEGKNVMDSVIKKTTISKTDINKLKSKTIYFGHQSVGYNIIEGINDILKKNNDSLKIQEINNVKDLSTAIFAHSQNGENLNPKSKVDSFVSFINNGAGKKCNIAFFKFCYVDIYRDSDVDSIFNYYQKNMKELKNKFAKVKFIHFTVPLTTYETSGLKNKIKEHIKSIIGRETNEERMKRDNIKRSIYNELVRSAFKKNELFDLAEIESMNPEGNKELFTFNGKKYESLVPAYTNDGGHLNEPGSIVVADRLLKFLAEII